MFLLNGVSPNKRKQKTLKKERYGGHAIWLRANLYDERSKNSPHYGLIDKNI